MGYTHIPVVLIAGGWKDDRDRVLYRSGVPVEIISFDPAVYCLRCCILVGNDGEAQSATPCVPLE